MTSLLNGTLGASKYGTTSSQPGDGLDVLRSDFLVRLPPDETGPNQLWLVPDLIPSQSIGMLYGPPGSFKSFTAIDICCKLVTGASFNGAPLESHLAAYLTLEAESSFPKRVKGWEVLNELKVDRRMVQVYSGFDGSDKESVEKLAYGLNSWAERRGMPLGVIIVDTMTLATMGLDENSNNQMSKFTANCGRLSALTGASVLIIHHPGKGRSDPRGSSSLVANMDYLIKIDSEPSGLSFVLNVEKQRDGDANAKFKGVLEKVKIQEPDGTLVDTLSVAQLNKFTREKVKPKVTERVKSLIYESLELTGELDDKATTKRVMSVLSDEEPSVSEDTLRKRFNRAKNEIRLEMQLSN
ncbi:AAA family ATPase [Idiomarina loihiensis]|uniref:AAA family ATPase n=1 Tax=Idiomarina loihiensis TaxID=135577 RepID=UPI0031595D22